MTITAAGLYGGQDPGASPDSTSWQTARFVVRRATTPPAPFSVPFVARSVQVDNASGSWYLVNGRRVPPWTVAAVIALDVPSSQLTIAAATPAGQLAEAIGEDLVAVVSDQPLAPFPGIYTPPVRAFQFLTSQAPVSATITGGIPAPATVVAANPGQRLAIRRIAVAPDFTAGLAGADPFLVDVTAIWATVPASTFTWYQGIGPESTYVSDDLLDGALVLEPGQGLICSAVAEGAFGLLDGGVAFLVAECQFYEVT